MNSGNLKTSDSSEQKKPLRWLPGLIIVLLQGLIRYGLPMIWNDDKSVVIGVFGGVLGGLAVAVWWLFFSRAWIWERWISFGLIIISLFAVSRMIHISLATANMGMMFAFFSIPVMCIAFVSWAILTRNLSGRIRYVTMVLTIMVASGFWTLLRSEGMSSNLHFDFKWRWSKTYEQKFLSAADDEKVTVSDTSSNAIEWTGFRGTGRNGVVQGVNISTDWITVPPAVLWRKQVGPGCSSFAVHGRMIYTQEQRGEYEAVTCYDLGSGKPVWIHKDKARFWDSHAGAGPRSTPTLNNGRVCTCGATGIVNVLNAGDGSVIWSRNAAADTRAKEQGWGFTGSPLVFGELVIVSVGGKMAAYDLASGKPRWISPDKCGGYSSPHLLTIDGITQILLVSDTGIVSVLPSDGSLLWRYTNKMEGRVLQPALTEDGDILVAGSISDGLKALSCRNTNSGWKVMVHHIYSAFNPYFNDFVIHKGFAYGFNGRNLECINLKKDSRMWKGHSYGGQLLLLADKDLLLLLSEKGEVALVSATPEKFTELAHMQAIQGKTWNHPVIAGDILLVRNCTEMAAIRIPAAISSQLGHPD